MGKLNKELYIVIDLVAKLNFKDISKDENIIFQKVYESTTYHRHDLIVYQYQNFINYTHIWGYGLENEKMYTFNISEDGIQELIKLLKEDFEKDLRKMKINKLLS